MTGLALVWIDGIVVDGGEASVNALDHGVTLGDGFFETIRVTDAQPRFLERHFERLHRTSTQLGLTLGSTDAELRSAIDLLIQESGFTDARVRMTATTGPGPLGPVRGGTTAKLIIAIDAMPDFAPSVNVVTVEWIRNERSPLAGIKSTSWGEGVEMLRRVRAAGAAEALLADSRGRLSEAIAANVFVVIDGELVTPTLATGCLPGVTRSVILDAGLAREADIDISDIGQITELFLTSAISGVRPVATIDGRPVAIVDGDCTRNAAATLRS